jgi:hypothetical protein
MLKRKATDIAIKQIIIFGMCIFVAAVSINIFRDPATAIAIAGKNITNQSADGLKDIFGGNQKTLKEIEDEAGYGVAQEIILNGQPNRVVVIGGKEYYVRLTPEGDTAIIANISTARDSGFVECNGGLPWRLYAKQADCCLNYSVDLCLEFAGYRTEAGEVDKYAQILVSSKKEIPLPASQQIYFTPAYGKKNLVFWANAQKFAITLNDLNLLPQQAQFTIEIYLPDGGKQAMCNKVWVNQGQTLAGNCYFNNFGKLQVDETKVANEPKYARISILPKEETVIRPK